MFKFFIKVGFINLIILFALSYLSQLHSFYLRDYKGSAVIKLTNLEGNAGGTGFGISYKGKDFIMTNDHVCRIDDMFKTGMYINMPDGSKKRARIVKRFKSHDLCLIKHEPGISTLSVGKAPMLGEKLHVVGYPALQPKTLTEGEFVGHSTIQVVIEEAFTRELLKECNLRKDQVVNYYGSVMCLRSYYTALTTVPILGGSSGSPVLNNVGNVVAVVFAGSSAQNNWAKLVPFKYVVEFLDSAVK